VIQLRLYIRMISEWWIGRDVIGSCHGIVWCIIPEITRKKWKELIMLAGL
jgi:hypothetical protein